MHAITVLVRCALQDQFSSILLLIRISNLHLVQAGTSTTVSNHTCAWTHTCKNCGYYYFKRLCPVEISNLIPVLEYLLFKLSPISHSNTLILAHIIKKNFNSVYCPCSIVTGISDWQLLYVCRCRSKQCLACYLYICMSFLDIQ